jgi:hypothetical protein
MSNEELWNKTSQEPIAVEIKRRKWRWIGHTLRKPDGAIEKAALEWNPQRVRKRGRPKKTWRRTIEDEAMEMERPGVKLRGWLTTEPDGKASLMPYAPVGATGTN